MLTLVCGSFNQSFFRCQTALELESEDCFEFEDFWEDESLEALCVVRWATSRKSLLSLWQVDPVETLHLICKESLCLEASNDENDGGLEQFSQTTYLPKHLRQAIDHSFLDAKLLVHVEEKGCPVFRLPSDRKLERYLTFQIEEIDLFIWGENLDQAVLQRNLLFGEAEPKHCLFLWVICHLDGERLERLYKGGNMVSD